MTLKCHLCDQKQTMNHLFCFLPGCADLLAKLFSMVECSKWWFYRLERWNYNLRLYKWLKPTTWFKPLFNNRPFPSSLVPLFQNESKCETFHTKMSSACSFLFYANQRHFHKNGFTLRLALKQRHKRTRKWPIVVDLASIARRPPHPSPKPNTTKTAGGMLKRLLPGV